MDSSERTGASGPGQYALPLIPVNPPSSSNPGIPYQQSSQLSPPRPSAPLRQSSSIRLRRLPSTSALPQTSTPKGNDAYPDETEEQSGRRRSTSAPQRVQGLERSRAGSIRQAPPTSYMTPLAEEVNDLGSAIPGPSQRPVVADGVLRRVSTAARSALRPRRGEATLATQTAPQYEYESGIVDMLDVVDPEVSTLNTLTNIQNSLFVPDLGRYVNRRQTYDLSRRPTAISEAGTTDLDPNIALSLGSPPTTRTEERIDRQDHGLEPTTQRTGKRRDSITSVLTESHYAVLPHGASLDGWSEEDKAELNDYVRHLMHSRRAKFKRSMRGFGKYVRKPLGFFVTLYAVLITIFGLVWVLFLIGWISGGNKRSYDINVVDNVLVALFAVVGDGLAPFRAVDTYHMCFIAHYHHLTWRLRREKDMPELVNPSDLPSKPQEDVDSEAAVADKLEVSVLTPLQQRRLTHHQNKFSKSHSFYKPHETTTHYAFPLRLLVAVVVLLDCHSLFQISLGAFTWGWSYHHRPGAITAVILCCSISCNIAAGITISVGDRKSRKKEVVQRMLRQSLTEEAMKKVEHDKAKRKAENRDDEVHEFSNRP